ncbi:hypothetical protein [Myroides sp. LJL119]
MNINCIEFLLWMERIMTRFDRLSCSKCKQHALQLREEVVKCLDTDCSWVLFREECGIKISIDNITDLIQQGNQTSKRIGLQS